MATVSDSELADKPKRVALVGRVSTEDQAERKTIQSQVDFLRGFCQLYGLEIVDDLLERG